MRLKFNGNREKAYYFIRDYILKNGYSPSFLEITQGVGLKSKSNAAVIVRQLEKLGLIKFHETRRSITLEGYKLVRITNEDLQKAE